MDGQWNNKGALKEMHQMETVKEEEFKAQSLSRCRFMEIIRTIWTVGKANQRRIDYNLKTRVRGTSVSHSEILPLRGPLIVSEKEEVELTLSGLKYSAGKLKWAVGREMDTSVDYNICSSLP